MDRSIVPKVGYLVIVVLILLGTQLLTSAQHSAEPSPKRKPVAVLNVDRVFKEAHQLQQSFNEIRLDVEKGERALLAQRTKLSELARQIEALPAGEPRVALQAELDEGTRRLRFRSRAIQDEYLGREAKIYLDAYDEIERLVQEHARHNGIYVVFRVDTPMIDHTRMHQSMLQTVSRQIVYQDGVDITDVILKKMNGEAE